MKATLGGELLWFLFLKTSLKVVQLLSLKLMGIYQLP